MFPFIKDKTPLITAFHRDKNLPFNVLRDVLNFKFVDADTMEMVRHCWLDFVSMNDDVESVKEGLEGIDESRDFWCASIRLANGTPSVMSALFRVWSDISLREQLQQPSDLPELLIASLIYHEKYDMAHHIFSKILQMDDDINWRPIVDVSVSLDSPKPLEFLALLCSMRPAASTPLYPQIIPHLRSLGLQETHLNRWNNALVSMGDFPQDSSTQMDLELKSQLETCNIRSFTNCLRHLSKFEVGPSWLQRTTAQIFVQYISSSKDQLDALKLVLQTCQIKNFHNVGFWIPLYSSTMIPFNVLDQRIQQTGLSHEHAAISQAKLKRSCKETGKSDEFWKMMAEESRADVIKQSSSSIISAIIQSSTLQKAYDMAIHLITVNPNQKLAICRAFITDVTKALMQKQSEVEGNLMDTSILSDFERYLLDNSLMNDRIANYYIFADLTFGDHESVKHRITQLLAAKDAFIDVRTVDRLLKFLESIRRSKLYDEVLYESMFDITVKALTQCRTQNEIPTRTWTRILMEVGERYDMDMIHMFFVSTAQLVKSSTELNIHPSNKGHPLRQVFTDRLAYTILDWGFIKSPDDPWSGFELIKALEGEGVYFQENLLKKHLLKLTRLYHKLPPGQNDDNVPQRLVDVMKERFVSGDVATTINKLNDMHKA